VAKQSQRIDARNPRLGRLHAYWDGERAERRMPSRVDIDPLETREWLSNDLLQNRSK